MPEYNHGVQKVEVTNSATPQAITGTLPTVTTVGTVSTMTTGNVVAKNVLNTITTAAIPVATPFTSATIDAGATLLYTKYRFRVRFDQPTTITVYHGASTTSTSNAIQLTQTVAANTVTIIEIPLVQRYVHVKIQNTGAATTTVHEAYGVLLGL